MFLQRNPDATLYRFFCSQIVPGNHKLSQFQGVEEAYQKGPRATCEFLLKKPIRKPVPERSRPRRPQCCQKAALSHKKRFPAKKTLWLSCFFRNPLKCEESLYETFVPPREFPGSEEGLEHV